VSEHDPHKAAHFIIANAKKYAAAKAQRMYLEEHRKALKALLMNDSDGKTVSDREQYAYSHQSYQELLQSYKNAILDEETLRIQIRGAELIVEIWRSEQATNRNQDKVLR
jgi:hypothetical protein